MAPPRRPWASMQGGLSAGRPGVASGPDDFCKFKKLLPRLTMRTCHGGMRWRHGGMRWRHGGMRCATATCDGDSATCDGDCAGMRHRRAAMRWRSWWHATPPRRHAMAIAPACDTAAPACGGATATCDGDRAGMGHRPGGMRWRSRRHRTPPRRHAMAITAACDGVGACDSARSPRASCAVPSSWFPLYDRNLQTFVDRCSRPSDHRKATHRVYRCGAIASYIELPVAP
jgi:hypothetical protein